ncbi:MAG: Fic family protein [Pseudomonadota bacterium]
MLSPNYEMMLHAKTLARLNGPASVYEHPPAAKTFKTAQRKEPDLAALLLHLRRAVTPLRDGWRQGPVVAGGGFTDQASVFPAPAHIQSGIASAQKLRGAAPLHHPFWNTLLLRLLLLRLHPFQKGNGRTMRALLSYELTRHELCPPHYLPLARVFDANRPALIQSRLDITQAATPAQLIQAVALALRLDATMIPQTLRMHP